MIKINKQLTRPDGGKVSTGSLLKYNPKQNGDKLTVVYFLTHYISQSALDIGKLPIQKVEEFSYVQEKQCTQEEFDAMINDAGAGALVEGWLVEIIDGLIGVGNTEIV